MSYIKITNAKANNLKGINLKLKLNQWISFVGKSGCGKSTLAADVIFGGFLSKRDDVLVPVDTALFRQKVSVPNGVQTISDYLMLHKKHAAKTLGSAIINEGKFADNELLAYIATTLNIDSLLCDTPLSELSLTTFNKVRFIKFLFKTTAKLLIIDELASGMSFAEAKKTAVLLRRIVKSGYSIITIEHSLPMIEASDYIVELGPGAGLDGGTITFSGTTRDYINSKRYKGILANTSRLLPEVKIERKNLYIKNINYNNLHLAEFSMPAHCIVNICGLSGSGKTSLLDIVFRAYDKSTNAWKNRTGIDGEIGGKTYIRRPHFVDQTPIGSNSMSTPATYTKIMDILRDIFAQLPKSKTKNYSVSEFSYNSVGGCSKCGGKGVKEIIIDDEIILETCPKCKGSRYKDEINKILLDGFSIGAMLQLPCAALIGQCLDRKTFAEKIGFIVDVGLPYLPLGQPSPSLSGGESQRIKITKELAKKLSDRSLFILDTPSRGLHADDLDNVYIMMRRLVSKNNSILIADNNPYFIRNADWVIYHDCNKITYQGRPSKLPKKILAQLGMEGLK